MHTIQLMKKRTAILSTISSLVPNKPPLDYAFEIENFKERLMNNTLCKTEENHKS